MQKNKLQPAVFNLRCETLQPAEKQTATSSIEFEMRNLKNKLQPAVFNLMMPNWKTNWKQQPERQTATSSI